MTAFKKGEYVRATYGERTVTAYVVIASENGRSLMISWMDSDDGMLGGHAGMMPILQHEDGEYRSLFEGYPVTLERVGSA